MRARPDNSCLAAVAAAALLLASAFLLSSFLHFADVSPLSLFAPKSTVGIDELKSAVLHYATTPDVPQQSLAEIQITFDVLRRRSPCNFLVFGLGLDSAMWSAFNAGGTTLFLEESEEWIRKVIPSSPSLRALHVPYRTRLDEADELLRTYKSVPECLPPAVVKGNLKCRLAMAELPEEVLGKEWDLIMIDAPRGFAAEFPGRMAAVWTAAVMARARRGAGETDVFIHDVDRRVEKMFAMEFLCDKFRVGGTGRLWHFRIPPANSSTDGNFC